jgi:hypothetical protein
MRRPLLASLLAVALVTACGLPLPTSTDQRTEARAIAAAIRSLEQHGATFGLDQTVQLTGGQIPSGQELKQQMTVTGGHLRDGDASFRFRLSVGGQHADFDMVIADQQLFARSPGAVWRTTPLAYVTVLFPALRLDLLRETALLAPSVSPAGLGHVDAGFARRFAISPAPEQLEELEAMPVVGAAETTFLRTARGEVDVYLLIPSGQLGGVELHLTGTDPASGIHQQIDGRLDLRAARVPRISPPAGAQLVDPGAILTG